MRPPPLCAPVSAPLPLCAPVSGSVCDDDYMYRPGQLSSSDTGARRLGASLPVQLQLRGGLSVSLLLSLSLSEDTLYLSLPCADRQPQISGRLTIVYITQHNNPMSTCYTSEATVQGKRNMSGYIGPHTLTHPTHHTLIHTHHTHSHIAGYTKHHSTTTRVFSIQVVCT